MSNVKCKAAMLEPNICKFRSHEEYSMSKEKYSLIDVMWTPIDNGKYLILIYCKRVVLSQSFGPYMSSSLRSPLYDTNPNAALLLMENPVNNGMNYQTQLVSRISEPSTVFKGKSPSKFVWSHKCKGNPPQKPVLKDLFLYIWRIKFDQPPKMDGMNHDLQGCCHGS